MSLRIVAASSVLFAERIFADLGQVTLVADDAITPAVVKSADILVVRSKTPVTPALLQGSSVRYVASATAGHDHIATEYLQRAGIAWLTAAGANANSVAEYIISALVWLQSQQLIALEQKRIAIIGMGHVGQRVAQLCRALGLTVLANDPPLLQQTQRPDLLPLADVLAEADIVSLHVPLTTQGEHATQGLANQHFFSAMKRGASLLNTSRGEVVDSQALLSALARGDVGHAVLDVWPDEPYIDPALYNKVTLATPHIAGYSWIGRIAGSLQVYQQLCHELRRPPGVFLTDLLPGTPPPMLQLTRLEQPVFTQLWKIIKQAYSAYADHQQWLTQRRRCQTKEQFAALFRRLRRDYPARLEFANYAVEVPEAAHELADCLQQLGFQVAKKSPD